MFTMMSFSGEKNLQFRIHLILLGSNWIFSDPDKPIWFNSGDSKILNTKVRIIYFCIPSDNVLDGAG
jgi:hypothetical protein